MARRPDTVRVELRVELRHLTPNKHHHFSIPSEVKHIYKKWLSELCAGFLAERLAALGRARPRDPRTSSRLRVAQSRQFR